MSVCVIGGRRQCASYSRPGGRQAAIAAEWTPDQLTDSELTERQSELERKLAMFSAGSPRRRVLQQELDALRAERKIRPQRRVLPLKDQLTAIGEQLAASRVAELDQW
jgi:hypothetical protein